MSINALPRPAAVGIERPAVFLDKDNTLVEDLPYNVDPGRIRLLPSVKAGLQLLHEAGFRLVVVSNQPGVAQGRFPAEALSGVARRLEQLVGVPLAGMYCCPHDPLGRVTPYAAACGCRKPAPGLLERAARELGLDLARSWMIGDILNDIEAGRRAGCRSILVDNGGETEWLQGPHREPHYLVDSFARAAAIVTAHTEPVSEPMH